MDRVWEKRKKKLQKATNEILCRFESESMTFDNIELYIRKAGSFNESEDNAQKEVHIALRGIAHTMVVLKSGSNAFLLDRVVEGIRLTELQIDKDTQCINECNRFKPNEMLKISAYNDVGLCAHDLSKWINDESQTKYNMITNSCVHFSFYFYAHFLYGFKTKQFVKNCMLPMIKL